MNPLSARPSPVSAYGTAPETACELNVKYTI